MTERIRPPAPRAFLVVFPLVLIILYFPLVLMTFNSLTAPLVLDGENDLTLYWFKEIFKDPVLLQSMKNSLMTAFSAATVSTSLGLIIALSIQKWAFITRSSLKGFSLLSLMLPELVLALSFLSWFAILGIPLSLKTVIIGHITLTLPFSSLTIGARLKALETSIEDAARDLGATEIQILWKIILPLLKPAMLTAFLLSFLISFDDFLITFYTNGVGADTLPIKLYSMMKLGFTPKVQALSTLMLLVSTILILGLNRLKKYF